MSKQTAELLLPLLRLAESVAICAAIVAAGAVLAVFVLTTLLPAEVAMRGVAGQDVSLVGER